MHCTDDCSSMYDIMTLITIMLFYYVNYRYAVLYNTVSRSDLKLSSFYTLYSAAILCSFSELRLH